MVMSDKRNYGLFNNNEFKFHKVGSIYGMPIIKELLDPGVKELLEIMDRNPGSYIEHNSILNFGRLYLDNGSSMQVKQGYNLTILAFLELKEAHISDAIDGTHHYKLHPKAMGYIKSYYQG
ncbi:hypothetical protein A0256_23210 [Mucilaginibacter sp. PAMC 26640]|nr:hypothetical protein A0256_23210 [Mucilaginibacter sp. PAMC 26640]